MSITTTPSLDMRGKTITTFIAYGAAKRLASMEDGHVLELVTDPGEDIDSDIRAWCLVGRHVVEALRRAGHTTVPLTRSTGVDLVAGKAALDDPAGTIEVAGPEPQDLVDMARRTLAARGQSLRLVPTWRGPFSVEIAG